MDDFGNDRLALMQTFVRIVEAGSLSAAAAQLNTTQPTVSRRLQALERGLGLRLLERSTHALRLTEGGAQCYERAKDLLDNWTALTAELRGAQEEPEGLLRVLVPHALGQVQLMQPLLDLLARAPRLNVEWLLADHVPNFSSQGLDCAIHVGELGDQAPVVALKLAEIQRIVVAAPSALQGRPLPGTPDELRALGLQWAALGTFYRNELLLRHTISGDQVRLQLRPRLITDNLYAVRNAVLAGLGAAALSGWLAQEDVSAGRLLHLLPGWQAPSLPVYLLYPQQRFYPAKLRHFIAAMRDSLRGPLEAGAGAMLTP